MRNFFITVTMVITVTKIVYAQNVVDLQNIPDTTVLPSIGQDTVALSPQNKTSTDTLSKTPKIMGNFWGVNISLSLGSAPLFTLWQNSLPDVMSRLNITPSFGNDLFPNDTARLTYKVTELPDQFDFVIPFGISMHNINDKRSISFSLSFFRYSKQFQSEIYANDAVATNRKINLYGSLSHTSISIEAAYQWSIPAQFFSIDNSERTFFSVAVGISPFNYITRGGDVVNNAPDDDLRMSAVADSVQKTSKNLSANGMSIGWRVGIGTLNNKIQPSGLEMGLYYCGSYNTSFYSNGENVTTKKIDDTENDKPLSFISNRIEFKFIFLRHIKSKEYRVEDKNNNAR